MSEVNKDVLKTHIPFLRKIIEKVKGTQFESKWLKILQIIDSDKSLSANQIFSINKTITDLKEKSGQKNKIKEEPVEAASSKTICVSSDDEEDKPLSKKSEQSPAIKKTKIEVYCTESDSETSETSNKKRKRITSCSESDSDDENLIFKSKTRKLRRLSSSDSNDEASATSSKILHNQLNEADQECTNSNSIDNAKISEFKNLLQILDSDEGPSNKSTVKTLFEKIVGKDKFSKLVNILGAEKEDNTETLLSPTNSREIPNTVKTTRVRKKKGELEKLQDDIMEMYMKDDILTLDNVRKTRKICDYTIDNKNDTLSFNNSFEKDSKKPKVTKIIESTDKPKISLDKKLRVSLERVDEVTLQMALQNEIEFYNYLKIKTEDEPRKAVDEHIIVTELTEEDNSDPQTLCQEDSVEIKIENEIDEPNYASKEQDVIESLQLEKPKSVHVEIKQDPVSPTMTSETINCQAESLTIEPTSTKHIQCEEMVTQNDALNNVKTEPEISITSDDLLPDESLNTVLKDNSNNTNPKKKDPILVCKEIIALESDEEQEKSSNDKDLTSKLIADSEQKVYYLSFVDCRIGRKYSCSAKNCNYSTTNEESFLYHIQAKHSLLKWCGYCNLCNKSVDNIGPLINEYSHMKNVHIDKIPIIEPEKRNRGRPKKVFPCVEEIMAIAKENAKSNEHSSSEDGAVVATIKIPKDATNTTKTITLTLSTEGSNIITQTVNLPIQSEKNPIPSTSQPIKEQQQICAVKPTVDTSEAGLNSKIVAELPSVTNPQNVQEIISKPPEDSQKSDIITTEVDISEAQKQVAQPTFTIRVKNLPGDKLSTKERPKEDLSTQKSNALVNLRQALDSVKQKYDHVTRPNAVHKLVPIISAPPNTNLRTVRVIPLQSLTADKSPVSVHFPPEAYNIFFQNGSNENKLKITDKLRPWLNIKDIKLYSCIDNMLKPACLTSLYKCMNPSCDFYTDNGAIFEQHLHIHKGDSKCSYCSFFGYPIILQSHILSMHGTGTFTCNYCFFRTVSISHINTHHQRFHKEIGQAIGIECKPQVRLNPEEELQAVRKTAKFYVQPISCAKCKLRFFNFEPFIEHQKKEHPMGILQKCNKCFVETKNNVLFHLKECHNINQYHCCYCPFATGLFNQMSDHLCDVHPEKFPYFCERKNTANPFLDPSSFETTTIAPLNLNRTVVKSY